MNERPPQLSRDSRQQVDRGCPREAGRIRVEGEVAGPSVTAERAEERVGNGLADDEQRDTDRKRYPERLRGESCRALLLTCAGRTGDNGCRAVGQEVEGRERPRGHGAGEPERSDLRAAEVADDRRVGENVERFGRRERRVPATRAAGSPGSCGERRGEASGPRVDRG